MPTDATTYTAIGSFTINSSQTEVTFSNIPQIYTDLTLVVSGTHTGSGVAGLYIGAINGDSGGSTFYSRTLLQANGSTASSARGTSEDSLNIGLISSTQSNSIFHFMNYSSSYIKKTILARGNDSSALVRAAIGTYFYDTKPITSFTISGVTFSAGTTFSLYGIGANQLKATGGNIITTDGTYWYHAFTSSGTFTPNSTLTCDVLIVAGGGAGGSSQSGAAYQATGGGAGGLVYSSGNSISAARTVTVGAGGVSSGQVYPFRGANGSNSTFQSLTAAVGGGGGIYYGVESQGLSGGSGGGGGGQHNTPTPGLGTSGQGNNGGVGVYAAGGGGGAGAVGGNSGFSANNSQAGVGGAGVNTYSAWLNSTNTGVNGFIAGGGGGGFSDGYGTPSNYNNGGSGGGGVGGSGGINSPAGIGAQQAGAGVTNTGGGGGGGGANTNTVYSGGFNGANGGSGLVIVRYPV
jgi:hypothetical protein